MGGGGCRSCMRDGVFVWLLGGGELWREYKGEGEGCTNFCKRAELLKCSNDSVTKVSI